MIIEVQDQLRHYSLENGEAYAVALTAKDTVETARVIHHLSPTNTAAVGRLMMGALLTASDIKAENGDVTCVIDGGGPAGKVLAVASPKGTVRAAIENPEVDLPIRQTDGKLDVSGILGSAGRLTVVKDNGGREPYIGQTQLKTGEVAEDFAYYFTLSEQRPCLIFTGVTVDRDASVKSAGAMAVFPLPGCREDVLQQLEQRATGCGLLSFMLSEGMTLEDAVQSIFSGMRMELTQTVRVCYQCNCSSEKMERALISIGEKDLREIIEEDHKAEIVCQFCNKAYQFDEEALTTLLQQATGKQ